MTSSRMRSKAPEAPSRNPCSPSPATTLSVFEANYLVAQIKVSQLMARNLVTVADDCPLEEAARIMVDNRISGLPVMRAGKLVAKVQILSVQPKRSVANVLSDWQQTDVMEGDQVLVGSAL